MAWACLTNASVFELGGKGGRPRFENTLISVQGRSLFVQAIACLKNSKIHGRLFSSIAKLAKL